MSAEMGSGMGAVSSVSAAGRGSVAASVAPAVARGGVESNLSHHVRISPTGERSMANGFAKHSLAEHHHTKVNSSPLSAVKQPGQAELSGLKASLAATHSKEPATAKVNTVSAPKVSLKSNFTEYRATPPGRTDTFNLEPVNNNMPTLFKAAESQQRVNIKAENPSANQPKEVQQSPMRLSVSREGKVSKVQKTDVSGVNNSYRAENKTQTSQASPAETTRAANIRIEAPAVKPSVANLDSLVKSSPVVEQVKKAGSLEGKPVPRMTKGKLSELYLTRYIAPLTSNQTKIKESSSMPDVSASNIVKDPKLNNDQRVTIPAKLVAVQYDSNLDTTLRAYELAEVLKESDPGWANVKPLELALEALHASEKRTNETEALATALEIGRTRPEADEEDIKTETQRKYEVGKVKNDIQTQEQTATQTDAQVATIPDSFLDQELALQEEEEVETEVAVAAAIPEPEQPTVLTQISSNGSGAIQRTTVIQGDRAWDEVVEETMVIDPETMNAREVRAIDAYVEVFNASTDGLSSPVKSSYWASQMPQHENQPSDVISPILKEDSNNTDDNSYTNYKYAISQSGDIYNLSQAQAVASFASEHNPAVKRVVKTTVVERQATEEEIRNVVDPSYRNLKQAA